MQFCISELLSIDLLLTLLLFSVVITIIAMSGRGRYRGNRNRNNHQNQHTLASVARETACSLPADSPVLALFKAAASKLNDRQDRHERLVKLSRDVTIESKRIIFLLHSAITKESADAAVKEAYERLQTLTNGPIKSIGLELEHSPAYLHSRAVSPGFQEFIEARTLCSVIAKREIIPWTEVQKEFTYYIKDGSGDEDVPERPVYTLLTRIDYMLGIADLTGELMRRAINSISSGDSEECFLSCQVVRDLYTGYIGLYGSGKELARKTTVTRSNVAKVEAAVYALKVRGGEAPPTLLIPTPQSHWEELRDEDVDEGFF